MEKGEKYWELIDPIWDEISIDNPKVFDESFSRVPRDAGILYAAHFCQSEVCNGGFSQFFWNSTGVLAPEAAEGFEAIGLPSVSEVVREAMAMIGSPYLRDRAARWEVLRRLSAAEPAEGGEYLGGYRSVLQFEPLESRFYSLIGKENDGFLIAADRYADARV